MKMSVNKQHQPATRLLTLASAVAAVTMGMTSPTAVAQDSFALEEVLVTATQIGRAHV